MPNTAWTNHLSQVRQSHPGKSLKECMQIASESYRTGATTKPKLSFSDEPMFPDSAAIDDDDVEAILHDSGTPRASLGSRPAMPIM